METFFGTWKFESSDNFEEYLKALGISAPLRKLAGLTSPTVTIKRGDEGGFQLGELDEESCIDLNCPQRNTP